MSFFDKVKAKINKRINPENIILIDETPSITPTEIRAKCRRLKRQFPDLGLVMVDYLQLMTVHGKTENRVQEISETWISPSTPGSISMKAP